MDYLAQLLQLTFPAVYQDMLLFFQSDFFRWLKYILGFYTIVLILDIILVIMLRDVKGNFQEGFLGAKVPIEPKSMRAKKWDRIKKRLEKRDVTQWKVAILEADKMVDEIVGTIGFKGKDLGEKLATAHPGQIDPLDELVAAHTVRNRVLHEAEFQPDQATARKTVGAYEKLLRSLEFI